MNRIADLREKRAKLWLEAKRFMDEHRGNDGCLDEVDAKIYEKMEADVVSLGIEIERLESQAHIDREVLKDSMDIPVERDKGVTITNCIQETNKILREIEVELDDMEGMVLGPASGENDRKSPQCLRDEAAYAAGLAYDLLLKLKRIKAGLI